MKEVFAETAGRKRGNAVMESKKKYAVFGVVAAILYVALFVFVYEVFDHNGAIIERGYPSTEKTYFALSCGWAPIALTCIAAAVFIASVVAYVFKRGEISFKKEALSIAFEIIVGVIYALPVLAITKNIPTTAYKVLTIVSCVLFAIYLAYRIADISVKAYRGGKMPEVAVRQGAEQ